MQSRAVDGTVYVGCLDAHVYAIDAATGRKKWGYSTSKSWVIGTPAVRHGMVFVGTSDSSRFMALDAKSRRLRFNFQAGSYMFSSAALAGDLAYVGDHNDRLYAIDAKSGKLAWEFQTDASKKDPLKVLNSDRPSIRKPLLRCLAISKTCLSTSIDSFRSARLCRRRLWTTESCISGVWTGTSTR